MVERLHPAHPKLPSCAAGKRNGKTKIKFQKTSRLNHLGLGIRIRELWFPINAAPILLMKILGWLGHIYSSGHSFHWHRYWLGSEQLVWCPEKLEAPQEEERAPCVLRAGCAEHRAQAGAALCVCNQSNKSGEGEKQENFHGH